jgi:8-oxo-dGTP pyrophosphatase MutT (NUDIX family)
MVGWRTLSVVAGMSLHARLTAALAAAPLHMVEDEARFGPPEVDRVPAAVLVPFVERPAPGVILTQRPQWLRAHAGQVAFPGGKVDAGDADVIDAALREAEEELGLSRRDIDVVGVTAPYRSGSGFLITPVIAVLPPDLPLDPNPDEVEAWFEVPAATLFNHDSYARHEVEWQGAQRTYHELIWEERRIWGVTAGIILNLSRSLNLNELVA